MYVELDKRVFKASESVLKEVSCRGRGLVFFIMFHLMTFLNGVVRCSVTVSKLLLSFELISLD